jgi:hypothetical protein
MEYVYSLKDDEILTIEEQTIIVEWVKKNYSYFKSTGYNRWFQFLQCFDDLPPCIWDIKQKIIQKENLYGYEREPILMDSIGYMIDGGQLHLHTDPNPLNSDLIHTRFNVYVQLPTKGGFPIYNGSTLKLKERTYICCKSGIDLHCCEKVEGDRARIIISFGFLIPKERIQNITYLYN